LGVEELRTISPNQVSEAAKLSHEDFLDQQRYSHPDPVMQPWAKLRPDIQESNRSQIAYIESILYAAGFGLRPHNGVPNDPRFTDAEIGLMAEMEHGRWNVERLRAGWRFGQEKDSQKKISPYLVPWSDLKPNIQKYDWQNVRLWPEVLARVGLEIHRVGKAGARRGKPFKP
jgi:hypothetical protein